MEKLATLKTLTQRRLRLNSELELAESEHLDYLLEEVVRRALNYCNLDTIPDELDYTIARMTEQALKQALGQTDGQAQTIKVGDTSVTLGLDSAAKALDRLMGDYELELNSFRRLRW